MSIFTRKRVENNYRRFIGKAVRRADKGDCDGAIRSAIVAAKFAYEFNVFLCDPIMEKLVAELGRKILGGKITCAVPALPKIVFYDAFGLDNKVLAQQYIRAIGASGYECLYLYEESKGKNVQEVEAAIAAFPNIKLKALGQDLTLVERVVTAAKEIRDFGPSKLFLQVCPWSVEAAVAVWAFDGVTRYNINLQDHAFGIGVSFVDFSIEFRNHGASLSAVERGIRPGQIIMLPYYPILRKSSFEGFPAEVKGRTILFSGGAAYKIYGEGDAFFKLVARLLSENPDTVLLFACGGKMTRIRKFIEKNKLQKRFILLGHRRDICEVYEHCDVFLSTYPFFGGLMTQYAAVYGKPILAYTDPKFVCNSIEEFVCHQKQASITYRDQEAFFDYARRICQDADFRRSQGAQLSDCILTRERFEREFLRMLEEDRTSFPIVYADDLGRDAVVGNYLNMKKLSFLIRFWIKYLRS